MAEGRREVLVQLDLTQLSRLILPGAADSG